ncbi:MAG: hypothetical protein DRP00_04095 [Candidatus Aenigmatarchaeota archaeon]|nr:MAG: hypothetical protein DRP00_04095 [Candidatus Aenigmarchaeota archaeon]
MRKLYERVKGEFIYGGYLSSLSAPAILLTLSFVLKLPIDILSLIVIFSGVHAAYLLNRYHELEVDILTNPKRSKHLKKQRAKLPWKICLFTIFPLLIILIKHKVTFLVAGVLIFTLGAMYSLFFKGLSKKIPLFKNFYAAFLWTLLIPLFLLWKENVPCSVYSVVLFSLFVFFQLFIDTSACDIKDFRSDKKSGLKTLPTMFGIKRAILILKILSIISVFVLLCGFLLQYLSFSVIPLGVFVVLYDLYYLGRCWKNPEDEVIYSILIDGGYIFWPLVTFLITFPYLCV